MFLAATVPLFGDSFGITLNITSTDNATTKPTGTYQGTFTTNGTCTLCTVANGGITSFSIPILTGNSVTSPSILVSNALDSLNQISAQPQYNTTTQSLSSTLNPMFIEISEWVNDAAWADRAPARGSVRS